MNQIIINLDLGDIFASEEYQITVKELLKAELKGIIARQVRDLVAEQMKKHLKTWIREEFQDGKLAVRGEEIYIPLILED